MARRNNRTNRHKTAKTGSVDKKAGKPEASAPKPEQYPHFRRYRKSGHPALIVGERPAELPKDEEYNYRKVMHDKYEGRHLNEEVKPNPKPKDPKPMYIAKRVRHDKKEEFSNWKYPWKYPKK